MKRREEGFAMVVAILVLFIAGLLASAAVLSATTSSHTAQRDRLTKRAIQAADAGIRAATFRMNRLDVVHTILPCVGQASGGLLNTVAYSVSTGWCPPVTEAIGNDESYSYVFSPAVEVTGTQVTLDRTIVATGSSGGVTRRVAVTASALRGTPLFGPSTVISIRDLNLANSVNIVGNTRSNGVISLVNSSQICGDATPGPGKTVTTANSSSVCAGFSTQAAPAPLVLPPVDQGNAATVNDNARICVLDPCSRTNAATWNALTRRLSLANQQTVVLGGNVYSFCQVDLANNSTLQIAPRAPGSSVRIYIDSPEACGGIGGGLSKANSTNVTNTNPSATSLQIYVAGSATSSTSVSLANLTRIAPMTLYAPNTIVSLANNSVFQGAIAALQITLANSSRIESDPSTPSLATASLVPIYRAGRYRECTPTATTSAADLGC